MARARIRWTGTAIASFLSDIETDVGVPRFRITWEEDEPWDLYDRQTWQHSHHKTLVQARMEAERIVAEER